MEKIIGLIFASVTITGIVHQDLYYDTATDYCKWEKFQPQCAQNEVIVVEKATFGRMKLGRCILNGYGSVGCGADVTTIAGMKCSGRKNCSILVPDQDMDTMSPCPADLVKYLNVNHSCLKVVQPTDTSCSILTKTLEHGYIASQTTDITGCGKTTLPWQIKASPGQTVNVTIHDFTPLNLDGACQMYVTFKESLRGKYRTLCGGKGRLMHAYCSSSHQLDVRIQTGTKEPKRNFLLEFQVLGCPQMKPPPNGWIKHVTDSLVHVGCLSDDSSWALKCQGHKWTGDYPECQEALLNPTADAARFKVNTPFSVIIVVCVALILGLSILITGICILKNRKNHPYARAGPRPTIEKELPQSYYGTAPPSYYSARNNTPDHEYEYVSDIVQPTSVTNPTVSTTTTNTTTATGSGHVTSEMSGYTGTGYGTVPPAQNAQLVIKSGANMTGNEYVSETVPFPCPKYFELDTSQPGHPRVGDNTYKSLHHCAHNSKQQFGHYSQ